MVPVLNRVDTALAGGDFKGITLEHLTLRGKSFGRRLETPIEFLQFKLLRGEENALQLEGNAQSAVSRVLFAASYRTEESGQSKLDFETTGINLNEWLSDTMSDEGVLGMDGTVGLRGQLPFAADGVPLDPKVKLQMTGGALRLTRKAVTSVESLDLDFQIFVDRNQVELHRSDVRLGKFRGTVLGGMKPFEEARGYHGPLLYDFIVDPVSMNQHVKMNRLYPQPSRLPANWTGSSNRSRLTESSSRPLAERCMAVGMWPCPVTPRLCVGNCPLTGYRFSRSNNIGRFSLGVLPELGSFACD